MVEFGASSRAMPMPPTIATDGLAVREHRVDDAAGVVHGVHASHPDGAELLVDGDFGEDRPVGVHGEPFGGIVGRPCLRRRQGDPTAAAQQILIRLAAAGSPVAIHPPVSDGDLLGSQAVQRRPGVDDRGANEPVAQHVRRIPDARADAGHGLRAAVHGRLAASVSHRGRTGPG